MLERIVAGISGLLFVSWIGYSVVAACKWFINLNSEISLSVIMLLFILMISFIAYKGEKRK